MLERHDSLFRGSEAKISKTSRSLNQGGLQSSEFWLRREVEVEIWRHDEETLTIDVTHCRFADFFPAARC